MVEGGRDVVYAFGFGDVQSEREVGGGESALDSALSRLDLRGLRLLGRLWLFFFLLKLSVWDETPSRVPLQRSWGHARGCRRQPRAKDLSFLIKVLRSGGLKVRLARVDCVGEFQR